MRIPVISIGNSKGIRIPQTILKQCGVEKEFVLEVSDNTIILKAVKERSYNLSFENIIKMSDKEIQSLLRTVDPTTLCLALLGCKDEEKDRVFNNLSKDAYILISEEIERLESMDAKSLIIEMHRAKINNELSNMLE